MRRNDLGVPSELRFEMIKTLLQLAAIACSEAGLLPLFVLARMCVPCTPAARWLTTVTFHLVERQFPGDGESAVRR